MKILNEKDFNVSAKLRYPLAFANEKIRPIFESFDEVKRWFPVMDKTLLEEAAQEKYKKVRAKLGRDDEIELNICRNEALRDFVKANIEDTEKLLKEAKSNGGDEVFVLEEHFYPPAPSEYSARAFFASEELAIESFPYLQKIILPEDSKLKCGKSGRFDIVCLSNFESTLDRSK